MPCEVQVQVQVQVEVLSSVHLLLLLLLLPPHPLHLCLPGGFDICGETCQPRPSSLALTVFPDDDGWADQEDEDRVANNQHHTRRVVLHL